MALNWELQRQKFSRNSGRGVCSSFVAEIVTTNGDYVVKVDAYQ